MRRYFSACALALALTGCAQMTEPLHAPRPADAVPVEPAVIEQARHAIDEGYGWLIALNRVIADNVNAKVWSPDYAQAYMNDSRAAREQLDTARNALRFGDVIGAKTQTELARVAIQQLQRRVAAAAQQGGTK